GAAGEEPDDRQQRNRAGADRPQEPAAHHHGEWEPEITLSDAVKAVEARLPQLAMPKDFNAGFGSEVEEQAKAFNQLRMVLILALVLVYAVMASQYESLRDPFIIMF